MALAKRAGARERKQAKSRRTKKAASTKKADERKFDERTTRTLARAGAGVRSARRLLASEKKFDRAQARKRKTKRK